MRHLACALLLAACATEPTDPESNDGLFELEPGVFVKLGPAEGKADLPNGAFQPRTLDTLGYRTIANLFAQEGYDLRPTFAGAAYEWPLADSRTVLSREGTPIRLGSEVYEHTGLDVIRASETESASVRAPTSGVAFISDWWGQQQYPNGDYSTVVSIWDPTTHHVLELMHVKIDPTLSRGKLFDVQRNQVIGELADIGIPGGRHTHVNVVDAEHFELIDPIAVMPSYTDTVMPAVGEIYTLDAAGTKHATLVDGPIDIILTAFDRDNQSPRNLEIESVAFEVRDQNNTFIGSLWRCHLQDAFKKLAQDWNGTASTIRLIDFGNATGQLGGFWPQSDLGNPDRLFRYAITNLRRDAEGKCSLVANDRDGGITVTPQMTEVQLTVDIWDARGNRTSHRATIGRPAAPPPQ